MGLDMDLEAHRGFGGYDHYPPQERELFEAIAQTAGFRDMIDGQTPAIEVRFSVAYWRKANAIHAWFIRNLANGTDDCKPIYVEREALERLKSDCCAALVAFKSGDINGAKDVMPPHRGPFFGSTDIDDRYAKSLEYTIGAVDKALAINDPKIDFYYHASW